MSDIVERLRAEFVSDNDIDEAADVIERLRAVLEDCIYGRKDWWEKARRALEPKP